MGHGGEVHGSEDRIGFFATHGLHAVLFGGVILLAVGAIIKDKFNNTKK